MYLMPFKRSAGAGDQRLEARNATARDGQDVRSELAAVHFSDLVGGSPLPTVDPTDLTGVEWQFSVPTDPLTPNCGARFSVSDVSFFQ